MVFTIEREREVGRGPELALPRSLPNQKTSRVRGGWGWMEKSKKTHHHPGGRWVFNFLFWGWRQNAQVGCTYRKWRDDSYSVRRATLCAGRLPPCRPREMEGGEQAEGGRARRGLVGRGGGGGGGFFIFFVCEIGKKHEGCPSGWRRGVRWGRDGGVSRAAEQGGGRRPGTLGKCGREE